MRRPVPIAPNQIAHKQIHSLSIVLLGFVGLLIGVPLLLVVLSFLWIRHEVASQCHSAINDYGGDCVEALPTLRSVYTGNIPDREPLDQVLSQYELAKAIRWCEQGNWTSWMYN